MKITNDNVGASAAIYRINQHSTQKKRPVEELKPDVSEALNDHDSALIKTMSQQVKPMLDQEKINRITLELQSGQHNIDVEQIALSLIENLDEVSDVPTNIE